MDLFFPEASETSARNNSSSEYVDIDHSGYVWETPNMVEVWASGTDVDVQFTSGNLVIGDTYQLIWNLSDSTSNVGVYDWGNVNWNATTTTSVENSTISGLADGVYYFHATLVETSNYTHIATDMTQIQMGNTTGVATIQVPMPVNTSISIIQDTFGKRPTWSKSGPLAPM